MSPMLDPVLTIFATVDLIRLPTREHQATQEVSR